MNSTAISAGSKPVRTAVACSLKTWLAGGAALGAVALAMTPMTAFAQAAAAATTDAPGEALGEVVVTAQRVETNVQRTAIAMDVIAGETLREQGISTINNLQTISPSISVSGQGSGGTVVAIRGITSRDTTEIGDPSVVVSVDGFYNDRSYALGLTQYDMQRIEVLRGPQGTLYGRNATGGAINIYTNRPAKDFGGYLQLEAGNYSTINTEGAVNIPVGDKVQIRGSFGTQFHDGYRDTTPYPNSDDANARSYRFQIAAQPIENLDIRFIAQHTVQTANGGSAETYPYLADAQGFVVHQLPPLGDGKSYAKANPSRTDLNDSVYKLQATYTAPFATFMYLGGYDRLKWDNLAPGWFFFEPANPAAPTVFPRNQVRVYNQRERPIVTNHEFRLVSPDPEARLTWQVGYFYFKNHNYLDSFNFSPNGTNNPTPVIHFQYDVRLKSNAVMGQIGVKVLDNLKLTAGIRRNDDSKFRTGYLFFAQARPATAVPTTLDVEIKKNTYHLGADWQVTDRSLVYAKYDTGYKSGGFTDLGDYGPEDVKTWEIGTKNRFFENRVQANFDFFHSNYTGQQVSQIIPGVGGGSRIVNAGASKIWGIEGEVLASMPWGRVELQGAYLHAEFTDFVLDTTIPRVVGGVWTNAPQRYQLAGNIPQQAPRWTLNAAYEYTLRDVMGGSLTGRIQTRYQSKQFYSIFNRVTDMQKGHAITNLFLTYEPNGENRWQVQGYIRNLTDERVFSSPQENDRNYGFAYTYQPPRTYGVRLSYSW